MFSILLQTYGRRVCVGFVWGGGAYIYIISTNIKYQKTEFKSKQNYKVFTQSKPIWITTTKLHIS